MNKLNNEPLEVFKGNVTKGHRVASGLNVDSPFLEGTIKLQKPFFKDLGLNLTNFYDGTINIAFNKSSIKVVNYDHKFKQVKWIEDFPPEDFIFVKCHIIYRDKSYTSYIYQPMKQTKIGHFQKENVLEVISPFIENLQYGDDITLTVRPEYITYET